MYLLIDWGNTRLKWMLVDELSMASIHAQPIHVASSPQKLITALTERLDAVFIASVRSDSENQTLTQQLGSKYHRCVFASPSSSLLGIRNSYQFPENMGIDRWLSIVAGAKSLAESDKKNNAQQNNAEQKKTASHTAAILSLGTAITLDIVQNNQHLGGQILPGKDLLINSFSRTGRVAVELNEGSVLGSSTVLGQSTTECVQSGIASMLDSYLGNALPRILMQHQCGSLLVSGGGAEHWLAELPQMLNDFYCLTQAKTPKVDYRSKIVFEGLALWAQNYQAT